MVVVAVVVVVVIVVRVVVGGVDVVGGGEAGVAVGGVVAEVGVAVGVGEGAVGGGVVVVIGRSSSRSSSRNLRCEFVSMILRSDVEMRLHQPCWLRGPLRRRAMRSARRDCSRFQVWNGWF